MNLRNHANPLTQFVANLRPAMAILPLVLFAFGLSANTTLSSPPPPSSVSGYATLSSTACLVDFPGTPDWSSSGNAEDACDEEFARVTLNDWQTSDCLDLGGFGLSIPPGATIVGIKVEIDRRKENTSKVFG
ncbi:MAG: hypothetical protein IPL49_05040 [Saprospirales bacterium]|nr:hypothetical protein [Saprospirales bacterium]